MQNLKNLASQIKHLNYVIQRNWKNLPNSMVVGEHDDLDLFVSEEDRSELELLIREQDKVDCRSEIDLYYPQEISDEMLIGRREYNGFWIPSAKAHFLSLYYHSKVHKAHDVYGEIIEEAFLEWIPPTKCTDEGVGYYV